MPNKFDKASMRSKNSAVAAIAVLAIACLVVGCAQTVKPAKPSIKNQSENLSPQLVMGKNIVNYAKNFRLVPFRGENCKGYLLEVRNGNSWQNYILYTGNKPNVLFVKNPVYIKIPVKRMVIMSSTHIAMLEAINATDCIIGYMYGGGYRIYFPDVAKKLKEGKIVDVGKPWSPDYEKIIELHPQLVVIYTATGTSKVAEKLKDLHIPYVVDSEWKENTPLGRVEWVKFFGALTCREEEAEQYFSKIVENVTKVEEKVRNAGRPTLAWALIYHGRVYMPTNDTYVANMVRDAGCKYVCANSSPTDIATLLKVASNADYFVYASYFAKNLTYIKNIDPRLSELKAFRNHEVYNITPDYWQLGYLHTDRVIEDLAAITHPRLFKNYKLHFFVRLK